jgi:hypothetical protein
MKLMRCACELFVGVEHNRRIKRKDGAKGEKERRIVIERVLELSYGT